ncbi:MAG TPA: ferritin [Chitinophagaceae bacterium]|nr:ferritin [Chitinophagaceae bacterium]
MGKRLLSEKTEKELNAQMTREAGAAQFYLSLGSWAEKEGYEGISSFLYHHSVEERAHMMKLLKFINQRGGHCRIESLPKAPPDPASLHELFENVLEQEKANSREINRITDHCLQTKDFTTFNFMMWFVKEQEEEEAMATRLLDSMKVIGENKGTKGGLYEFDRQMANMHQDFPLARDAGAGGDKNSK